MALPLHKKERGGTDPNKKNQPVIEFWTFEDVQAMTPEEIGDLGFGKKIDPYFQNLEHWNL